MTRRSRTCCSSVDNRSSIPAPVLAERTRSGFGCDSYFVTESNPSRSAFVQTTSRLTGATGSGMAKPSGAANQSTRSALSIRSLALRIPSISIRSLDSRNPAVSTSVTGSPFRSSETSIISRVVPGISETIATSRLAMAFNNEDFPAFGAPAMTTLNPSLRISPRRASARQALISRIRVPSWGCSSSAMS